LPTVGATDAPVPTGDATEPIDFSDDLVILPDRSADDSDTGWGDPRRGDNDERLLAERPPHWG
jgi:hypothetical protein